MEEYERLLSMREENDRCGGSRLSTHRHAERASKSELQTQALARIVQNPDGTQRLVPTSNADPTSSEFQRLFGPQGTLTDVLGVGGVGLDTPTTISPFNAAFTTTQLTTGTGCPTGATGCNLDPYFHFPDLDKDSGDCLYIPTFNDVPVTLSMAVYFAQAFLKEVSTKKILEDIDGELKDIFNRVVEGNLFFNYIPIAVIIIVLVWVMVIHGLLDWKAGLLLTFVFIAVFWVGYLLLDTTVREDISTIATKTSATVSDSFNEKNENIIGSILKGYYTAVNHMILPEAAICGGSPTGSSASCGCYDTGKKVTVDLPVVGPTTISVKVPLPSILINDEIENGGDLRCLGINNKDTLLPTIDSLTPCLKDVEGFNLSNLTSKEKEDLFDCVLDNLPTSAATQCSANKDKSFEEKAECLLNFCGLLVTSKLPPQPPPPEEDIALCRLAARAFNCSVQGL